MFHSFGKGFEGGKGSKHLQNNSYSWEIEKTNETAQDKELVV